MGGKPWRDCRGLPLKDRFNVVITSDPNYKVRTPLLTQHRGSTGSCERYDSKDVYVIGGESVYRLNVPYCDTAYVTRIDYAYNADAYFPNLDEMEGWQVTDVSDEQTYYDLIYYFYKYEKKNH